MIEPETNARNPIGREIKKAKQWMLRERDVKNIIARAIAEAQEKVSIAGGEVWKNGGALEPYQQNGNVIDSERNAWKERRFDDANELTELLRFVPAWEEVYSLGNANATKHELSGEYTEE